ncbi:hypothetical protein ACLOJK_029452 [Asimina triloba]
MGLTLRPFRWSGVGVTWTSLVAVGKAGRCESEEGKCVKGLEEDLIGVDRMTIRSDGMVVVVAHHTTWCLKSRNEWDGAKIHDEIAREVDKFPTVVTVGEGKREYDSAAKANSSIETTEIDEDDNGNRKAGSRCRKSATGRSISYRHVGRWEDGEDEKGDWRSSIEWKKGFKEKEKKEDSSSPGSEMGGRRRGKGRLTLVVREEEGIHGSRRSVLVRRCERIRVSPLGKRHCAFSISNPESPCMPWIGGTGMHSSATTYDRATLGERKRACEELVARSTKGNLSGSKRNRELKTLIKWYGQGAVEAMSTRVDQAVWDVDRVVTLKVVWANLGGWPESSDNWSKEDTALETGCKVATMAVEEDITLEDDATSKVGQKVSAIGVEGDTVRASGGGRMYARADAGETSVLGVSTTRHGRDPRQITDVGHQAGRSGCMRRRNGARLDKHTGRSACGLETCYSCGAGRRVWNHYVASRWHVTGQTLD